MACMSLALGRNPRHSVSCASSCHRCRVPASVRRHWTSAPRPAVGATPTRASGLAGNEGPEGACVGHRRESPLPRLSVRVPCSATLTQSSLDPDSTLISSTAAYSARTADWDLVKVAELGRDPAVVTQPASSCAALPRRPVLQSAPLGPRPHPISPWQALRSPVLPAAPTDPCSSGS